VIDANSGIVMQTLPWNFRGWHCGSGSKGASASCNNTHIGVEMCESKWIKYTGHLADFEILDKAKAQADCKRAYNAAVELFALLCQMFDLDPLTAILSHKEGGKAGIASGHVDPEHYWTQLGMDYTMDGFRQAVKDNLAETPESPETGFPFVDVPEKAYYRKAVEWAYANGITAGTSKTMFSPDRPITRAEAVTMMRKLYKLIVGGG
jgi:N-acetylmuramoyl-L-alanine amidase./S-layer homology domain.